MNDIIKNIVNHYKWAILVFLAGLALGWLIFHSAGDDHKEADRHADVQGQAQPENTIWTCSMHPQIRQSKPGKCPICAMDLIPLSDMPADDIPFHPDEIEMTASAAGLADIQTIVVKKGSPNREIYLQGKVQPDERFIAQLTARFGGRIEKLFVSFTGEQVRKGQKLATIYSPELLTAQRELLEAKQHRGDRPSLYQAARSKLMLWDLTEEQIDAIEQSSAPQVYFDVLSPLTGTVTERHVASGDYLKEGSAMFEVIDLTRVWVLFDAYETDLPWISVGDHVDYTIQSIPGASFSGKVSYIDPFINPDTRVAKVRVQQPNAGLRLKPEMFVSGTIESRIAGDADEILVPKSSILWTGKRAIVYVRIPDRRQPTFQYREIGLGPEAGNFYVVNEGLQEGEEIAMNGVFKIDAAAQLAGKKSMMNPEGAALSGIHDHGSMDMHSEADGKASNRVQKGIGKTSVWVVDSEFKKQIKSLYDKYLVMKNSLVESDPGKALQASADMMNELEKVNMDWLEGDALVTWRQYSDQLDKELKDLLKTKELTELRQYFSTISNILYSTIKTFGMDYSGRIYYQYCPMAFEDQGAYWLSEIEEISNPYFGDMMLRCGETREIVQ